MRWLFRKATALAARGLSMMIDVVTDNQISNSLKKYMTFTNPLLGEYPDVIGFLIPMVSLVILSFDVKTVTNINNVCCLINLGMFTLITLVIGSNLNFDNWFLPPSKDCGKGGFLPYGLEIVFQSIAAVYNSYIGFDAAGHADADSSRVSCVNNTYKHLPQYGVFYLQLDTCHYLDVLWNVNLFDIWCLE